MLDVAEDVPESWQNVTEAIIHENLLTVFNTVKDTTAGLVSLDEGCCKVK